MVDGNTASAGPESYSVAEAAKLLQLSDRTLRSWIAEGKVTSFEPQPPLRGARIHREEVDRLRQTLIAAGQLPADSGATGGVGEEPEDVAALRQQIAVLEAERAMLQEHVEEARKERDRWREQANQLTTAMEQERILRLREAEGLGKLAEALTPKALPEPAGSAEPEAKRPWWKFGRG